MLKQVSFRRYSSKYSSLLQMSFTLPLQYKVGHCTLQSSVQECPSRFIEKNRSGLLIRNTIWEPDLPNGERGRVFIFPILYFSAGAHRPGEAGLISIERVRECTEHVKSIGVYLRGFASRGWGCMRWFRNSLVQMLLKVTCAFWGGVLGVSPSCHSAFRW